MNAHEKRLRPAGLLLLLALFFAIGSLPAREKVLGPEGEAKRLVAGALAILNPDLRRYVWEARIAGSLEEWRAELGCYPPSSLGLCKIGTGSLVFPAFDGRTPRLFTIYHEVGHAVWYNGLGRADRLSVERLFARGPWPTKYSRKNAEEFFAEVVGLRLSKGPVDGLPEIDELLGRASKGISK